MTRKRFEEAEPIVRAVARRFSGGGARCGLAVEDLEQEARIALVQASKKFKAGRGKWTSYVHTVAFNVCQKKTRRDFKEVEFNGSDFALPESEEAIAPEDLTALRRAISSLPKFQRALVRLRFGLGPAKPMKVGQLAKFVGLHRETARIHLAGALVKIRHKLARRGITS